MSYPGRDTIRNSTFARTRYFPMPDADEPTFLGQPNNYPMSRVPILRSSDHGSRRQQSTCAATRF